MANPVKIKVIVTAVVKHTDSVVSYRFFPQGRVHKFRAGQFLRVALDKYHPAAPWTESRVFSVASSTARRSDEFAVALSVKGRFTDRIFQTLDVDSTCWLKLPYGEFVFPPAQHLMLIAGGVGITPHRSLLQQMLEENSEWLRVLEWMIGSNKNECFMYSSGRCAAHCTSEKGRY